MMHEFVCVIQMYVHTKTLLFVYIMHIGVCGHLRYSNAPMHESHPQALLSCAHLDNTYYRGTSVDNFVNIVLMGNEKMIQFHQELCHLDGNFTPI